MAETSEEFGNILPFNEEAKELLKLRKRIEDLEKEIAALRRLATTAIDSNQRLQIQMLISANRKTVFELEDQLAARTRGKH